MSYLTVKSLTLYGGGVRLQILYILVILPSRVSRRGIDLFVYDIIIARVRVLKLYIEGGFPRW